MAEMMQKWGKFATPGKPHEHLALRAGHWDHHVKSWCDPDPNAPPMESTGTTKTKMILGGRFLLDHSNGEFNGEKFEGMGITGYDNLKKKYVTIWIDSMGTGMMVAEGEADSEGKVFTYKGTYSDPMAGKVKTSRMVETIVDDETWKMEMFEPGPGRSRKEDVRDRLHPPVVLRTTGGGVWASRLRLGWVLNRSLGIRCGSTW